ncbi:hypothetical protein OF83DRAFT_1090170 [Amylostereum chailletii]|nr:hypothetical protein OF83DRAFT_1090170 [Amylostereum chailletii]
MQFLSASFCSLMLGFSALGPMMSLAFLYAPFRCPYTSFTFTFTNIESYGSSGATVVQSRVIQRVYLLPESLPTLRRTRSGYGSPDLISFAYWWGYPTSLLTATLT